MDDKKTVVAVVSAAAVLSALAILIYKKRQQKKKSNKEESVDSHPDVKSETAKVVIEDNNVDVSVITTPEKALSMAMNYMALNAFGNAIKCYSKGIKLVGMTDLEKRKLFFSGRSQAYLFSNRIDDAISDCTECINLFPLEGKLYESRADIYIKKGSEEKALHDLTMYTFLVDVKNIPETIHEKMNSLQQSIGSRLASREIERRKTDPDYKRPFPPKSHFMTFLSYFESEVKTGYNPNNWSLIELTQKIQQYTEGDLSLGDLYLMRGGYLKNAGAFKEAIADFDKAALPENHCHDLFAAKLEQATFRMLLGEYDEALALFAELNDNGENMSMHPNWVNFYVKYATAMVNRDPEKALEIADKAVALYPENSDIHIARGSVFHFIHKIPEAVEEFKKSLAIKQNSCALMYLTMCYGETDMDKAIKTIEKAKELEPENVDILNACGDMYLMKGQYLSALGLYDEAIRLNPSAAKGYVNKASLYLRASRDTKQAGDLLHTAIQKDPSNVQAYILLLQLDTLLNKRGEMQELLQKALKCAIDEEDVAEVLGYKFVIEESIKCEELVKTLRSKQ